MRDRLGGYVRDSCVSCCCSFEAQEGRASAFSSGMAEKRGIVAAVEIQAASMRRLKCALTATESGIQVTALITA